MSEMFGEQFENYGNALECPEPTIPAYEELGRGWARLFVCKTVGGKVILDHTDVLSIEAMYALAARLREIADRINRPNELCTKAGRERICHRGH